MCAPAAGVGTNKQANERNCLRNLVITRVSLADNKQHTRRHTVHARTHETSVAVFGRPRPSPLVPMFPSATAHVDGFMTVSPTSHHHNSHVSPF
eukprot:5871075-Prymnesium_polylepis.1